MLEDIKVIHLKSNAQQLETWIAMLNGEIVGHIYMEREENDKIKFLDAWVHEEHRLKGVFRKLWDHGGKVWVRVALSLMMGGASDREMALGGGVVDKGWPGRLVSFIH